MADDHPDTRPATSAAISSSFTRLDMNLRGARRPQATPPPFLLLSNPHETLLQTVAEPYHPKLLYSQSGALRTGHHDLGV